MSIENGNGDEGKDFKFPTSEVSSEELLKKSLVEVATYGKSQGGDPSGDFFDLPNGNTVYVTSEPANTVLKPGEICIGRYNKAMRIKDSVVVTSPEEALKVVKEWGEK